jgi:hypothetical protein
MKVIRYNLVAWYDEKHLKVRLGHASKRQNLVAVDAHGEPTDPLDGGVFPEAMPNTSMKFPGECRMLAGIGVRWRLGVDEALVEEAFICDRYWYTDKQVVGFRKYDELVRAEMATNHPCRCCRGA